jgi:hypothetical protein
VQGRMIFITPLSSDSRPKRKIKKKEQYEDMIRAYYNVGVF